MTRFFTIIFLIFFICFIQNCKKGEDTPVFNIEIDDEFFIDMREELKPNQRSLSFWVQTIEKKDCQNTSLDYSFHRNGNTFIVSLNDLVEPEDCIQDSTYIEGIIPTAEFSEGTYFLQINLKEDIINKGRLSVSPEHYELSLDSHDGISLRHPKLYRLPSNSAWGYVAYHNSNDSELADELMAELSNLAEPAAFSPGYYGFFELDADQQIELQSLVEQAFHTNFLLQFDEDKTELANLINSYRQQYPAQLEIHVFTAEGESL